MTMAHEGMHGLAGSLTGGRVTGIWLKDNAKGLTKVSSGGFLFYFAGYLGPSAFGLGAARLIQFGHIVAVLWLCMLMLGLLLLKIKWSFGIATVPLAGFLIFLVLKHTSQTNQIQTSPS
jgi:hypothetical protein